MGKNLIKKEAKRRYPFDFWNRYIFKRGAKWAVKNLSTESVDYVKNQIELLDWLQEQIGTDYCISPHKTYEQLVEEFNKQK